MKKVFTILVLLITVFIGNAQILTIPDANFKAKLLYSSPSAGVGKDQQGNNITIDTNNDNEIELSEALSVYSLNVNDSNISDLTGLNNFSNLTELFCNYNNINDLAIVSTLTNLKTLYCPFNHLTVLDLTANTALETVFCNENQLSSLEIGNCANLKNLSCNLNLLTSLATSNLHNLESVQCSHNFLTELHINNSPNLYDLNCSFNSISQLDLTGIGQTSTEAWLVFFLDCSFNNLSTLDTTVMADGARVRIECGVNPNLTSIYAKNGATFLDDNPHTPPFPGLYINGLPNLQYICVDSFNVQYVVDKVNLYGYTNVTVNSACSLSTSSDELNNYFSIYPNPATIILNLENKTLLDIQSIQIYNMLQQMIFTSSGNNRRIDVSNLKTGTYLIRIETDKGFYNAKFIKS